MILSEEQSRKIFIVSFTVFALPSVVLIAAVACAGTAIWVFFALAEISRSLSPAASSGDGIPSALLFAPIPAAAVIGLVALWKFCLISSRYVSGGRRALVDGAGLLWSALVWSAIPTIAAATIAVFVLHDGNPLFDLGRIYISGLPLFVPLGHLVLELKGRRAGSKPRDPRGVSPA